MSSFSAELFEPFVSPEVAAKHLEISRRELLAHARSGRFPGYPVDPAAHRRDWRFKLSELDKAMNQAAPQQLEYNSKRQPGTRKAS